MGSSQAPAISGRIAGREFALAPRGGVFNHIARRRTDPDRAGNAEQTRGEMSDQVIRLLRAGCALQKIRHLAQCGDLFRLTRQLLDDAAALEVLLNHLLLELLTL